MNKSPDCKKCKGKEFGELGACKRHTDIWSQMSWSRWLFWKSERYLLAIILVVVAAIWIFFCIKQEIREYDLAPVELSWRASYLGTKQTLARIAAPQIEKLIRDAEKEGMCLVVVSGYRTKERQQKIWDQAIDKSIVAKPGTSEHEKGLAVDLGGCPMIGGVRNDAGERLELRKEFEELPEYEWLVKNAAKYGFSQSYTEGNSKRSGFPAEAWHWRYNY